MKHFRPIKTFATWLLEEVNVWMPTTENDPWNGQGINDWIEQNLGLKRASHDNELEHDIFIHTCTGFPTSGKPYQHNLHFPTAYHADKFLLEFGGEERQTRDMNDNIRKNEAIFGNFTFDDLKIMYGDPLPNVIQYHIVDMQDRLSGYLDDFKYMHQAWARNWIPSAFIYIGDRNNIEGLEKLRWLHDTLEPTQGSEWTRSWQSSAMGMYEFDDPAIATLFKLRFGEDKVPRKASLRRQSSWDKLHPHVSGLYKNESGIWWEPDPKAPNHAILLI